MNNEHIEEKKTEQVEKEAPGLCGEESNALCPVCGYYCGAMLICCRCGAKTDTSTSVRTVRKIALVGSFVGIALLWVAAYIKKPELINIGEITETMNNAFVIVEGRVTKLYMSEEKNSLSMVVNDGSGVISMMAFNKLDRFRKQLGDNMPMLNDKVRVSGSVNISLERGLGMFLSVPSRLQLVERYEIKELRIKNIRADMKGEIVWVQANVKTYNQIKTKKGGVIHKLQLQDGPDFIDLVIFSSDFDSLPEDLSSTMARPGTDLKLKVEIDEFRGKPQIKLYDAASGKSIEVLKAGIKRQKEDYSTLESKEFEELSAADDKEAYMVTVPVSEVSMGQDDMVLSTPRKDIRVLMTYEQHDSITGFSALNAGNRSVKAPFKVYSKGSKIYLRLLSAEKLEIK
jgi:DNA/RNA endonuclease YhcR with UshA esterase domain